jgi:hypothetical protein
MLRYWKVNLVFSCTILLTGTVLVRVPLPVVLVQVQVPVVLNTILSLVFIAWTLMQTNIGTTVPYLRKSEYPVWAIDLGTPLPVGVRLCRYNYQPTVLLSSRVLYFVFCTSTQVHYYGTE